MNPVSTALRLPDTARDIFDRLVPNGYRNPWHA